MLFGIAAAGLLELSQTATEPSKADCYRKYAFVILDTLLSPEFLANETPGWEGILKHGIYHERKKLGVDESVMWGEYFFLTALEKAVAIGRSSLTPREMGRLRQGLAIQYAVNGDPKKALAVLFELIRNTDVKGARGFLFNAQRQVAERYIQLGDFNQAEAYVRRNQALLQEARGWPTYGGFRRASWEADVEWGRARLFEARGQFREAEASYKRAGALKDESTRLLVTDTAAVYAPPGQLLVVSSALRGDLGLPLADDLLTRLELHPCLSQFTFSRGQVRFAFRDPLLEGSRLLVLDPSFLLALLECAHQLRLARLGLVAGRGHPRFRLGEVLLTLGDLGKLLLHLGGRGRALAVADLELLHLQLDELLAFREPRLQLRELLLRLQQAVQLRQPLGHSALALVELGLGLRQRRRPTVEPGRLLCELLLELRVMARGVDVVVQRRTQLLLARE